MPFPEYQKSRTQTSQPIRSTLPTGGQKRISTGASSLNAKSGAGPVTNTITTKKKSSGRQKASVKQSTKSSIAESKLSKVDLPKSGSSSAGGELGLTKLLAAASAAVAVSPGVMRRGIEDQPPRCIKSSNSSSHENTTKAEHDKCFGNDDSEKTFNNDSKDIQTNDPKYNTFARAIEMLPAFDDIDDGDDDEIEVPEILRDTPNNEEALSDALIQNKAIDRLKKNITNQTPETREKCKAIESKMLQNRRHYKKDSRFVLDLYTLTFDEDEDVDSIDTRKPALLDSSPSQANNQNEIDQIRIDLSKIQLKENSSYVTNKNNYHEFASLEDYLMDYMSSSSKSFSSIQGDRTNASSTTSDVSLQSKPENAMPEDENDNIRSLSGIR